MGPPEDEEPCPSFCDFRGTLAERPGPGREEGSGMDSLLCSVLKRPNSAHAGFCADVKIRGKKGRRKEKP